MTRERVACLLVLAILISITLAGHLRLCGPFRVRTLFNCLVESPVPDQRKAGAKGGPAIRRARNSRSQARARATRSS
jgi:hypothetical protein